jgi:hypothetical protein
MHQQQAAQLHPGKDRAGLSARLRVTCDVCALLPQTVKAGVSSVPRGAEVQDAAMAKLPDGKKASSSRARAYDAACAGAVHCCSSQNVCGAEQAARMSLAGSSQPGCRCCAPQFFMQPSLKTASGQKRKLDSTWSKTEWAKVRRWQQARSCSWAAAGLGGLLCLCARAVMAMRRSGGKQSDWQTIRHPHMGVHGRPWRAVWGPRVGAGDPIRDGGHAGAARRPVSGQPRPPPPHGRLHHHK